MKQISPITLSIFKNLFAAICEEMGVVLARSAFSPNIKEREDFSCALFNAKGKLVAQAAHIPVHLGSMELSVAAAIQAGGSMQPGDIIILNDPYAGGTHLPDITMVAPVYTTPPLRKGGRGGFRPPFTSPTAPTTPTSAASPRVPCHSPRVSKMKAS